MRKARTAADEANRAKSDFLSHMTHEIRTPMTVIMGSLEQLAAEFGETGAQVWLELAKNASERLLTLVGDLLDLSRIEAGRLDIRNEPFTLMHLIESTVRMFELQARQKGLALKSSVSSQVPEVICGDPDRLGQVLVNLIGNALKFTDCGAVEVMVQPADTHQLQFDVRDTGIGIPADKMDRLFQRFSQVDPARSRKYGGTGLGLALSKSLVEGMGGTIWAQSAEGHGSVFSFTLPLLEVSRGSNGCTPNERKADAPSEESIPDQDHQG